MTVIYCCLEEGNVQDVPRLNDETPSGPDGASGHESEILC
jgi:hypothetical protein